MTLPLSVLDLSPVSADSSGPEALRRSLDLARLADRVGYTRYWLAEHHNIPSVACSAPEIMIGQVARETSRLRVGSGGVMLPNHAPLAVAENFRVLEALFPGRVDLGIGRAPGTDRTTAVALRGSRAALGADDFPEQLAELLAFGGDGFPDDHPFRSVRAMPVDVPLPPVWLLGSSGYSAEAAAAHGLGCAFALHINPSREDAAAALRLYRARFQPSERFPHPRTILALSAVCADTAEQADYLAATLDLAYLRLSSGRPAPLASPEDARNYPYSPIERAQLGHFRARHLVGTAPTVRARIEELVALTEADEVMVVTGIYGHAERLRSYELLAGAFGLTAAPEPVATTPGADRPPV